MLGRPSTTSPIAQYTWRRWRVRRLQDFTGHVKNDIYPLYAAFVEVWVHGEDPEDRSLNPGSLTWETLRSETDNCSTARALVEQMGLWGTNWSLSDPWWFDAVL